MTFRRSVGDDARIRRSIAIELSFAAAALLAAAVLGVTPPPGES